MNLKTNASIAGIQNKTSKKRPHQTIIAEIKNSRTIALVVAELNVNYLLFPICGARKIKS